MHESFASREDFDRALAAELRERGIELVVLAGFMRVLTSSFLDQFPHRVVNIRPALLLSFPGVHAQKQAFDYGVKLAGCTVHFVDAGTDTGPIIAQAAVPVLPGDDEEALQKRILAEEHRLLPAVVRAVAAGKVTVEGRRVTVVGEWRRRRISAVWIRGKAAFATWVPKRRRLGLGSRTSVIHWRI